MRRDAHPPHTRSQVLSTHGPATAGALLTLALTLATGALHSSFLLVLPLAVLPLLLALARSDARLVLGFGAITLIAGQAVSAGLGVAHIAAALAGAGALDVAAARLRRRADLRPASALAGRTAPTSAPTGDRVRELHTLLERTRTWTGAPAMTVWQCTDGVAHPIAVSGRTPPPPRPLEGDPLGWVVREGTPLWFAPTPAWSEPGASVAALRLRGEPDAWLVTGEYAAEQGRPALEDLDAACAGLRLLVDVLADRERTDAEQLRFERLLVLLKRIPIAVEPEAFGDELLSAALSLTTATGAALGSWLDDAGTVICTAGQDGGPQRGDRFLAPGSELALAVRARARIDRLDGQWRPGPTHVANENDRWQARPRALTCVPLATAGGPVGAIALWSSRAPALDGDGLDMLEAVLPYAALHLEHATEFGRLRERADHDVLTGLRNRRAFETAFHTERQRFERYGHPLALLILDIDHFKAINDAHGHEAGDEVLRAVAAVIRSAVRDVDVPARFGGEEFVVLLPETPLAAAHDVAERVRAAVAAATVVAAGRAIPVRASVGVSACPDSVAVPGALLGSADGALYAAKRGGRDRVVVATSNASTPGPRMPRAG